MTLRSAEIFTEYELHPPYQPTSMLLVMALGDHLTATDLALEAYERVLMPMLIDGHFDAYETDFAS